MRPFFVWPLTLPELYAPAEGLGHVCRDQARARKGGRGGPGVVHTVQIGQGKQK